MAYVWGAIAIGIIAYFVWRDAPTAWYAITIAPFLMAALGVFQARARTCVFLAGVGQADLDEGARPVTDAGTLAAMRRQAASVWIRSAAVAIALTAVAMLISLAIQ
jgi:hypothetical protein